MAWTRLCATADVQPGGARLFQVEGRPVLVVNDGQARFASEPRCPHLGLSLEGGEVTPGAIRCRAHGYKMSLATGECLSEKGLKLSVYPLEERDGSLWAELPPLPSPGGA